MEKITITRIGQEKTINYTSKKTGQPDSFKKVGVLTNEYGDRWMDITFRGEVPVKVGQSYEVEVSEREYNGKTYYDAKLPQARRQAAAGVDDATKAQFTRIERTVNAILNEIKIVKGGSSSLAGVVDYPESMGRDAFSEPHPLEGAFNDIDPADIPF